MFERFTDAAKQVIVVAQQQAGELDNSYIGSEHLALGLIIAEEEGIAPRALTALGASKQVFLDALANLSSDDQVRPGEECEIPKSSSQQLPFTPRAKRILELSLREALSLGHNYIGTEHILLGFIRENEGVGPQVLEKLEVSLLEARQRVMENFQHNAGLRSDPLKELEWHLRRAQEQIPLIRDRLLEDNGFKRVAIENIGEEIEKTEEQVKKFHDSEE